MNLKPLLGLVLTLIATSIVGCASHSSPDTAKTAKTDKSFPGVDPATGLPTDAHYDFGSVTGWDATNHLKRVMSTSDEKRLRAELTKIKKRIDRLVLHDLQASVETVPINKAIGNSPVQLQFGYIQPGGSNSGVVDLEHGNWAISVRSYFAEDLGKITELDEKPAIVAEFMGTGEPDLSRRLPDKRTKRDSVQNVLRETVPHTQIVVEVNVLTRDQELLDRLRKVLSK